MNRPVAFLLMGLFWALAGQAACAQTQPDIQTDIQADIRFASSADGPIWKGQAVDLYLELWSDAFSFSSQSFQLPEVSGGYLIQGSGGTTNLTERRGPQTWQGLRYDIKLFPQRTGSLEIPAFPVKFEVKAGFGTEPQEFRFNTDPLRVDVQLPPGANPNEILISSTSYQLEYQWSPQPAQEDIVFLKVGDALVLEVERSAVSVPGMMFEPLHVPQIDGLGVYTDKPGVEDVSNRGSLTGQREDRVTFVAEKPGKYELPEQVFQAWDPVKQELSVMRISALAIEVAENPAYASTESSGVTRSVGMPPWLKWLVLALLVLGGLGWRYGQACLGSLRNFMASRRKLKEQSEAGRFRRVQQACRSNDARASYQSIMAWLNVAAPGKSTLLALAHASGSQETVDVVVEFEESVFTGSQWKGGRLEAEIEGLRVSLLRGRSRHNALPPLNPS